MDYKGLDKSLIGKSQPINIINSITVAYNNAMRLNSKAIMAIVKDCRARFWSQVAICVIISNEEFMKVWDICEERKIIRFNNKKWLKATLSNFDKFNQWLGKCDEKIRFLIMDYGIQVSKRLEKQIRDLYLTFKIYFDRKGQTDTEFKAQVQVAITLIHLAHDLFDNYFDLYHEHFGFDIRQEYMPARLHEADINFEKFAEGIIQPTKYSLCPVKNYASICAFDALADRLLDEKMIDEAGIEALKLNHEDEFLDKIERKKMGVDKLKEKYGGTKTK